ncbi:MAG: biotin synthase [Rubrivivax sp.]|nr:biotin synthase [Rubrivivax sp.]
MAPPERSARRPLDTVALARVQQRLQRADSAPWLHGEVARRMAERLPIIKLQPARVIDWGAFLGASRAVLAAAYPRARLLAVEPDAWRRDATAAALEPPWWSPRRWTTATPAVVAEAELGAGQGQLLWSNMGLHGAVDPQAVMKAWHRALEVDGFLMFSTLGPGSLQGLRALYAAMAWPPPHAPFVDMHDLGDMLLEAGFAEPVMDQETITLTWPTGQALLAELRQLGGNVDLQRHAGVRTPRWRDRLAQGLQAAACEGEGAGQRPRLAFEVVYGHALRAAPRPRVAASTTLPLADLRAMVRAGRRQA